MKNAAVAAHPGEFMIMARHPRLVLQGARRQAMRPACAASPDRL